MTKAFSIEKWDETARLAGVHVGQAYDRATELLQQALHEKISRKDFDTILMAHRALFATRQKIEALADIKVVME